MKEKETGSGKKGRGRKTKHTSVIWRAIGTLTESALHKQGFSKRIAKKVVWGWK